MQFVKDAFSQLLGDLEFLLPAPRVEHAKECILYVQTKTDDKETVHQVPTAMMTRMFTCIGAWYVAVELSEEVSYVGST